MNLEELLSSLSVGPVQDVSSVERLLIEAWDSLAGSDQGGMQAYKLRGRTEDADWQPPCLTFVIERHGGTVMGSTRAELQTWCVNISSWSAAIISTRRRQLEPTAPRLDVRPLAQEVADAILHDRESPSLKRLPDGRVKVLIGTLIPDVSYQQTTAGRRRRFRQALEALIRPAGWEVAGTNTYRRRGELRD